MKFAKVMFLQVCLSTGGRAWQGSMHDRGRHAWQGGGVHGRGEACMAGGRHAWQGGGVHGRGEACMAGGGMRGRGRAWQGGGMHGRGRHAW